MNISTLINELIAAKEKHGDVPVEIMQWDRDSSFAINYVELEEGFHFTDNINRLILK